MKLIVSEAAIAELKRLHVFLAENSPAAADRAIAALVGAIQSLDLFPERGRPSTIPDLRELIVLFGRFGYVLRYAYSASTEEVVIIRIWHGREMPD